MTDHTQPGEAEAFHNDAHDIAAMRREGGTPRKAQDAAHAAYQRARSTMWAPLHQIDLEWRDVQHRSLAVRGDALACWRIARAAEAAFDRYGGLPEAEARQVWDRDRQNASIAMMQSQAAAGVAAGAAYVASQKVAPADLVAALAARGIVLSVVNSALTARPARLLTDADRTALRNSRDDVIAAIGSEIELL